MKVNKRDIFLDIEDELTAIELELVALEEEYEGAKWMFLPREWAVYVQKKVRLKQRLRKLKDKLGYDAN